jgi:hypothetical protein
VWSRPSRWTDPMGARRLNQGRWSRAAVGKVRGTAGEVEGGGVGESRRVSRCSDTPQVSGLQGCLIFGASPTCAPT